MRNTDHHARSRPLAMAGLIRAAIMLSLGLLAGVAGAAQDGADILAARYSALRPQLEHSTLGLPIVVDSQDENGQMRGETYAILAQPFATVVARLRTPQDWCQIVILHLNVKTCTYERSAAVDWLTFYSGRKVYEPPEKGYPLRFSFQVPIARADYLEVALRAESGPLSTRNYQLLVEAIPLPQGTFVHFRYAYTSSFMSRIAMDSYLATIGRDKVGFTVLARGADGKVEYVGERRGIVERNAVRYYFAIEAFLEGQEVPEAQRFEHRLSYWFDQTERYPAQLHELDKPEYLQNKRQEYQQQIKHQQALDAKAGPAAKAP